MNNRIAGRGLALAAKTLQPEEPKIAPKTFNDPTKLQLGLNKFLDLLNLLLQSTTTSDL